MSDSLPIWRVFNYLAKTWYDLPTRRMDEFHDWYQPAIGFTHSLAEDQEKERRPPSMRDRCKSCGEIIQRREGDRTWCACDVLLPTDKVAMYTKWDLANSQEKERRK